MKTKIITCIYNNLFGSDLGGRLNRHEHYKWSLLSLVKMTDADFVCYTSENDYNELCDFFYNNNNISSKKLQIIVYDLKNSPFNSLIKEYTDYNYVRNSDRCITIQYMKFVWFQLEDMTYDYYYWFDAGLSHCGIIPNKYLTDNSSGMRKYYESSLFNNSFLKNLIEYTGDKFFIITKENVRNYWSGTVDPKHFIDYDRSRHVIGGVFGGKKQIFEHIAIMFNMYVYSVTKSDNKLYHEEDIMTLMYRNAQDLFTTKEFDIWWHEDERYSGIDIDELLKDNKSFYKILEELNI